MTTHVASSRRSADAALVGLAPARLLAPRRFARITARLRRASLDRALARGADPAASPALAARPATLTTTATRAALADGLERVIRVASGPTRRSVMTPPRAPVIASAASLSQLDTDLRGDAPLYARGLAMIADLLTDGTGALYAGRDAAVLETALRDARRALAG